MIDIYEAAKILGKTPRTIRKMCQYGELPATKTANGWQIDKSKMILPLSYVLKEQDRKLEEQLS